MATKDRYIIKDREQSLTAEAFRALCASIQDTQPIGKLQTVLFVGANAGESAAMTAINAAATLAYAGKKVVLVDCDLRHPILCEEFYLQNFGLTNMVEGHATAKVIMQEIWIPNLKVITTGPLPIGPISILSNAKIRKLLEDLRSRADFIFLTSSPILVKEEFVISDACVLASKVDGVILVIDSRKTKPKAAQKVVELLNGAKANIIGTVLNDVISHSEIVYYTEIK